MSTLSEAISAPSVEPVRDVEETTCCIVGGGPGGSLLAFILAKRGVPVLLLEAHKDFDREFRGDTIHPALLEILDELGLAERLHERPHVKLYGPSIPTVNGPRLLFDFRCLKTKFPYIMLIHQGRFLEFLTEEARKLPQFHLKMGASVQRLVEEQGAVRGVRYRDADGWHEVRAVLTVGADGRFSRIRHLGGFQAVTTSPPIELLWFRLPRLPADPKGYGGLYPRFIRGHVMFVFDRIDHWQVGYLIRPGEYPAIHAAGLQPLCRTIVELEPRFADHVKRLTDWSQLSLLSVSSSRCLRWSKPGLLLIGDAAHVMTPAAGAGIKYAMEDAVVAANLLTEALKAGHVEPSLLSAVQRRREWPTRLIQAFGAFGVRHGSARFLDPKRELLFPRWLWWLSHFPLFRYFFARMLAFGLWRVHVRQ
jgi:2-polyprenyl-6-methoxyphenol hydroxylase-like FAD-dependent oxidoreductase